MKTQHTPGPWHATISTPKEVSDKWGGNCGANAHIFYKTGKYYFGIEKTKTIVFLPHWRDEKENEEQIANAKLIAAAPDMLEVLEQIRIDLNSNMIDVARKRIDNVINKAKGL